MLPVVGWLRYENLEDDVEVVAVNPDAFYQSRQEPLPGKFFQYVSSGQVTRFGSLGQPFVDIWLRCYHCNEILPKVFVGHAGDPCRMPDYICEECMVCLLGKVHQWHQHPLADTHVLDLAVKMARQPPSFVFR